MERFGVSDVDELDGFCRPTKKEQEAIRRLVGFRYSQKDRFLLISFQRIRSSTLLASQNAVLSPFRRNHERDAVH